MLFRLFAKYEKRPKFEQYRKYNERVSYFAGDAGEVLYKKCNLKGLKEWFK